MRISFRTKILLCLVLTVVALLGGALLAVERAYASKVEELVATQVKQGRSNFDQQANLIRRRLTSEGWNLATNSSIVALLDEETSHKEIGGVALYEMEYHAISGEFLVITTDEGHPVARYIWKAGATRVPGEKIPLEPRPVQPGRKYAEAHLVERLIAGDDTATIPPFIVEEDRLFQVVTLPIFDGERFQGVVVLGSEITDEVARQIHALQADEDGAGYGVGDDLVAASFTAAMRDGAHAALGGGRARIQGNPYHVVVTSIHHAGTAKPIFTALFISLRSLYEFRDKMRLRLVALAGVAILVSLALSVIISRSVSAPVQDLVEGTRKVAGGDYSHRIRVRSHDELGDLAAAFNRMATDLATKEKIRGVLNKVVAKDVAEELLKGDLGLGGRLVRATLLYADIRGFTGMTQGMDPRAVVAMLNEYMTAMSQEILSCKGIVDKYVGDEIIGVFGAPKSYGHDAFAGFEAAHRMRERLGRLNEVRRGRGDPPLAMGIGLHTGEVVAGCMGSEELLSYTCIGAAMNLAARLCSSAKPGQILVSEAALSDAGGKVEARPLEPIHVKGFDAAIDVFEVIKVELGETAKRRRA